MIGSSEILIIGMIVLVLFGGNKIPSLMRQAGKGLKEIEKAKQNIKEDLNIEDAEIIKEVKEIKDIIKK